LGTKGVQNNPVSRFGFRGGKGVAKEDANTNKCLGGAKTVAAERWGECLTGKKSGGSYGKGGGAQNLRLTFGEKKWRGAGLRAKRFVVKAWGGKRAN